MDVTGSVALVTGANRGLGAAFARGLLAAGAKTVYGAARTPFGAGEPGEPGIVPVTLDITDASAVADAAAKLTDVTLLVNNAGVFHAAHTLDADAEAALRADFETNTVGTFAVARAFAPILAANGGGAIVNVLSIASWAVLPRFTAYAASKAASWSITNSLRLDLREQGTQVMAVHSGFLDTDMAASVTSFKTSPDDVVAQVLSALAEGADEVLVDDATRAVKRSLSGV